MTQKRYDFVIICCNGFPPGNDKEFTWYLIKKCQFQSMRDSLTKKCNIQYGKHCTIYKKISEEIIRHV